MLKSKKTKLIETLKACTTKHDIEDGFRALVKSKLIDELGLKEK